MAISTSLKFDVSTQNRDVALFLGREDNTKNILELIPASVFFFNNDREIVYANAAAVKFTGSVELGELLGKRLGEVLCCAHISLEGIKCGSTIFCEVCGMANAILDGQRGLKNYRECRMIRKNGTALDLSVNVAPVSIGGKQLVMCTMIDVGGSKRKDVLEHIFFHDVLNTVSCILGYAEMIKEFDGEKRCEIADSLYLVTTRLVDEVQAQRQLMAAEQGDMIVTPAKLDSLELIRSAKLACEAHKSGKGKLVCIDKSAEGESFVSDGTMVKRVLNNMLKNALEASNEGEVVWIGCEKQGDKINFWVKNSAFIPREIELQIFKRSFSTKGRGRGVGTYSMKLLSEHYLKGSVSFVSSKETGTVFTASYPLNLE